MAQSKSNHSVGALFKLMRPKREPLTSEEIQQWKRTIKESPDWWRPLWADWVERVKAAAARA